MGLFCKKCATRHVFVYGLFPKLIWKDVENILLKRNDRGLEYNTKSIIIFLDRQEACDWQSYKL